MIKKCECDPQVGFFCTNCCLENQYIQDLQNKYVLVREALVRVMNSDLVTTTHFRDYSEAFDNAREVLEATK